MSSNNERDKIIYTPKPAVHFASNLFVNVPVILQYKDRPLIATYYEVDAGFTAAFDVYNEDGARLAIIKGTQVYKTPDGEKSGLVLRYLEDGTVAELTGRTLFELRRTEAAALKAQAELFTHTGQLVRCDQSVKVASIIEPKPFTFGGVALSSNMFVGAPVGIHIDDNRIAIGGYLAPERE